LIKELKRKLEEKYDELSGLGSKKELTSYLKEEFDELKKQGADDFIKTWGEQKNKTNKNNLLIPFLMGYTEKPKKLEHHWKEGDYPDIDLDFCSRDREKVKQYLRDKWGTMNVLEVGTFGGTNPKSAIQDLSRVIAMTSEDNKPEAQEIFAATTKIYIPPTEIDDADLEYLETNYPHLKDYFKKYPKVRQWLEKIEGCIRHTSTHACATIISDVPVDQYLPVIRTTKDEMVAGLQERAGKKELQPQGFIKFDLLGLSSLTVFKDAKRKIKERHGIEFDWDKIGYNEKKVFKNVKKGELDGVFQMESAVAKKIIDHIQPDHFVELSNVNALIRPGNLDVKAHESYRNHKEGKFDRVTYPVWLDLKEKGVDEELIESLDNTFGIPLYQEQIMLMVHKLGGFSLEETNKIRKLIGVPNKTPEMKTFFGNAEKQFIKKASEKLVPALAKQWWDTCVGACKYSFNFSHSLAYSVLAYRQLYIKSLYPLEFYWALLKNTDAQASVQGSDDTKKIRKYIEAAKRAGIKILPPSVNYSEMEFGIKGYDSLIFGLSQIKQVGDIAAKDIIERRPYKSFEDFLNKHTSKNKNKQEGYGRSKVTKRVVEALIVSGALDEFNEDRNELFKQFYEYRGVKKDIEKFEPYNEIKFLELERDAIKMILSDKYSITPPFGCNSFSFALNDTGLNKKYTLYGYVSNKVSKTSKNGNRYTLVTLTDYDYDIKFFVWRGKRDQVKDVKKGDILKVKIFKNKAAYLSLDRIDKHIAGGSEQ